MEEKNGKSNTVLLAVIGAATLLVVVVGATFAYFAASLDPGTTTATVDITTSDYGNTTIIFPSNNTISLLENEMKESEKGTDYEENMLFAIDTTSTVSLNYKIYFENISNGFCKYIYYTEGQIQNAVCKTTPGVCSDSSKTILDDCGAENWTAYQDVRDDVTYRLEKCKNPIKTGAQYSCGDNSTPADLTDDFDVVKEEANFPGSTSGEFIILDNQSIPAAVSPDHSYQLYRLVVTLHNKNTVQNYNEEKEMTAMVKVDLLGMEPRS